MPSTLVLSCFSLVYILLCCHSLNAALYFWVAVVFHFLLFDTVSLGWFCNVQCYLIFPQALTYILHRAFPGVFHNSNNSPSSSEGSTVAWEAPNISLRVFLCCDLVYPEQALTGRWDVWLCRVSGRREWGIPWPKVWLIPRLCLSWAWVVNGESIDLPGRGKALGLQVSNSQFPKLPVGLVPMKIEVLGPQ